MNATEVLNSLTSKVGRTVANLVLPTELARRAAEAAQLDELRAAMATTVELADAAHLAGIADMARGQRAYDAAKNAVTVAAENLQRIAIRTQQTATPLQIRINELRAAIRELEHKVLAEADMRALTKSLAADALPAAAKKTGVAPPGPLMAEPVTLPAAF